MNLRFTKMHGLGNDFVVLDAIRQPVELSPATIRHLADRKRGIGCDQVLVVEQPQTPACDFHYRIFNADGGEVEQCGNGARCFAAFVRAEGLTDKDRMTVSTSSGIIYPRLEADGGVSVDMGVPCFEPAEIPFLAAQQSPGYDLEVDGRMVTLGAVSIGNPHAVLLSDNVDTAPVESLGPPLEHHHRFPRRTNVGFMQVLSNHRIRLRVHERGVGETMACGTGACAAVVVGRLWGLLDSEVKVELRGGELTVRWLGEGRAVAMTGPAVRVFEGQIEL